MQKFLRGISMCFIMASIVHDVFFFLVSVCLYWSGGALSVSQHIPTIIIICSPCSSSSSSSFFFFYYHHCCTIHYHKNNGYFSEPLYRGSIQPLHSSYLSMYQGLVVIGKQGGACSSLFGCLHTHCKISRVLTSPVSPNRYVFANLYL